MEEFDKSRLILVEDWEYKGFQDCKECFVDYCDDGCEGPSDLPNYLGDTHIEDLRSSILDVKRDYEGNPDCSGCSIERKVLLCESRDEEVGIGNVEAILVSPYSGQIVKVDICRELDVDTGLCSSYDNRPNICEDHLC